MHPPQLINYLELMYLNLYNYYKKNNKKESSIKQHSRQQLHTPKNNSFHVLLKCEFLWSSVLRRWICYIRMRVPSTVFLRYTYIYHKHFCWSAFRGSGGLSSQLPLLRLILWPILMLNIKLLFPLFGVR